MGPISGYLTPVAMLRPTAKDVSLESWVEDLGSELRLLFSDSLGMWGPPTKKRWWWFHPHCFRETKTTNWLCETTNKDGALQRWRHLLFLEGFGSEGLGLPDVGIIFCGACFVNWLFQKGQIFLLFWGGDKRSNVNLSNEKRAPGCPALCRAWKLPRYVGNLKNHYKNPY